MSTTYHEHDEDCTPDEDGTCGVCGVQHGPPCIECGKRAFHTDNCPEMYPASDYDPRVAFSVSARNTWY